MNNKKTGDAAFPKTDRELMEMALWALGIDCEDANGNKIDLVLPAIQALRERLSQPEPNAVLAEREACAKLCESMDHEGVMIAADCAEAIRARGEK